MLFYYYYYYNIYLSNNIYIYMAQRLIVTPSLAEMVMVPICIYGYLQDYTSM